MTQIKKMKSMLESKQLDGCFSAVYTPDKFSLHYKRYLDVLGNFTELFDPEMNRKVELFSAPGRSEIGGNHTDHNHGKVLAASISLDAIAVAAKNDDGVVRIKSAGYPMDVVSVDDLEINEEDTGHSQSLVRGIMRRFVDLGYNIGGIDACTSSLVLGGSGLSSSAAFEVLVCAMLNHLYNGGKISDVEIAKISQWAENVHFGKPCGLLDQMACSVGGFVAIDFCDPEQPVIEKVGFDFASCGHSLCIVDTKGSHSDLTDDYAAVRGEMEAVAAFFGKSVLREVSRSQVIENAADISRNLGERAVIRALHFFGENDRVDEQKSALESGDFERFKRAVIASGRSSYMYNQNVYTCKQPKNQPLSLALAVSEIILSGKGAWRVHGGGFAGTIQAFVPDELLDEYTKTMNSIFGDDSCHILSVRPCGGVKLA